MKIKHINHIESDTDIQFYDVINAQPYHNFLIHTKSTCIVSHNCSFEDEVSFQPNADIEKQKKKARELISSIDARMSSRFMKGEKLPTLHILASSKRTDQSFLETYIDMKRRNESKTTLIIDEPQWVIRTDKDSPNKFAVAVGNKFLESEVLPLSATEQDFAIYRDRGYSILLVPMGYHEQFIDDINIALTDIAGISTSNSTNYISGVRWTRCRNDSLQNPFTREILEVGNGQDDIAQYYDFFDLSKVPRDLKSKPLYIHLDMSISGDKTGIAGVWIKGKKPHQDGLPDSKELFYQVAFSVSIKAPKGRQISFEKNRQFIYWLREQGFNIKTVSFDTFNSVDLGQALQSHGFNCQIISVDRTTAVDGDSRTKVCIPYQTFRNAINEERIAVYKTTLLTAEIVGLVRDGNGKIDHSPAGINSKDQSDAVCLHEDTKIFTLDGKNNTIKELYELQERGELKDKWVLSYDTENERFVPTEIKEVINNGYKNNLIKLTLDNGEYLICTRDHLILDRAGKYIKAEDTLDVSLMPFSFENKTMYKNRDYLYIYEPKNNLTNKGIYLHRLIAETLHSDIKTKKESTKSDNEWLVIHHKDCDRFNNNPENLTYLTNVEHSIEHAKLNSTEHKKDQLRKANQKRIQSGNHPFLSIPKTLLAENGRKNLQKLNRTEKHRRAVSENNKRLAAEGKLSFQLHKENSHSLAANKKRENTCKLLYGDVGFKSAIIQDKCRKSCLEHNGYDNPFRSAAKQNEMKIRKAIKTIDLVYEHLGLNKSESLYYLDLKIELYKMNAYINSDPEFLKDLGYNIDTDGYDKKIYENLRTKATCVKIFLRETNKNKFTYDEFSDFYDKKCAESKGYNSFKVRFKHKPTYEDILRFGFNLYNHRVIKIDEMPEAQVFDLKLPKIHNFALMNGLIVHNCGAVYSASLHAEEFAYDYGEQSEQLLRANEDPELNDMQQLSVSLEAELKNMHQLLGPTRVHPSDAMQKTGDYSLYDDIIIL